MRQLFILLSISLLIICVSVLSARAQQTGFIYQGKLTDNGSPANGNYDLQFALFDAANGGAQIGQTQTVANVAASGGVFTVRLDFGPSAFPGAARFLEISTRPSGAGAFTLLTPRQQISSTPYAVRSLSSATAETATNATNADTAADSQRLGGVTGDKYVQTNDARLSDARPPMAGSPNYIQNTTTGQANTNFAIAGTGTVLGTFNASQVNAGVYKLDGVDVISSGPAYDIQLGRNNGSVGIGIKLPYSKLDVHASHNRGLRVQTDSPGGWVASFGGLGDFLIDAPAIVGGRFAVKENGDVFIGKGKLSSNGNGDFLIGTDNLTRVTVKKNGWVGIGWADPAGKLDVNGDIRFSAPGSAGSTHLCLNGLNQISFCSSSLRYKTDLHPFTSGLNLINRLHPITFKWKADQTLDLGLGAEDVAAVEPMLVTHNKKGEIEGVKYDRLSAVFINAFKEQQTQIKQQQDQIDRQQSEATKQQEQISSLRRANDELNARLQSIEKILKRKTAARRR
jgi:hypothetical protein